MGTSRGALVMNVIATEREVVAASIELPGVMEKLEATRQ
jgi:hypothetical protein